MGDRFRHAQHVVRMGVVLGVGLVAFLIARAAAIPSDFGVLGYYRAGALDDNRAVPIVHAGRTACLECHDGMYDPPEPGDEAPARTLAVTTPLDPVKDNKHYPLNCESCHGPLQKHVADEDKELEVPKVASDGLCLGCHSKIAGRPRSQPQILPAIHKNEVGLGPDKDNEGCAGCHKPHWPKTAVKGKGK
jgi:predicted CXXCH cytochrome family protein